MRRVEHAPRMYFVNFPRRTDWHRQASTAADAQGRVSQLVALEELRRRLRTRHYSYRTECSYVDWARRFLTYLSEQQNAPEPRVQSDGVRD